MHAQDEQNKNKFENAETAENIETNENVESTENVEINENVETVESVEAVENVETNENVIADEFSELIQPDSTPNPKKSKKGLIAILVVVAMLIASVAIFWKPISNFAIKTIKSPEEYYAYVEKKNLENTVEDFYEALEAYEIEDDYKIGSKYSLKLETGEGLSDVVSFVGADPQVIDWLKSIELAGNVNATPDVNQGSLQGLLNNKELFDLSFIVDSKNKVLYAALPILTGDKHIKFDLNEYVEMMKEEYGEDFDDSMINDNMFKAYDITEFFPEEDVAEALLLKYFDIIVSNLGKAEKKNDKLTIGNATQSCTLITYEIDEIDFYNASKAVLEEAKNDKEIEKIVKKLAEKFESDPDEVYSSFLEGIDEAIDDVTHDLEEAKEKSEEELKKDAIIYKVWISNSGEAVARAFEAEDDKFFMGTVKDGKNVVTEISLVEEDEEQFKFEGEAVLSSKKLSGKYKLIVEGKELLVIDVENVDVIISQKSGFNGKLTLSVGKDFITLLSEENGAEFDNETKEYIETAKLIINAEKNKISYTAETKGKTIIKITASIAEEKYKSPSYPDDSKTINALDEEALDEMLAGFDVESLIDKLKEAGIPEELIESILGGSSGDGGDESFDDFISDDFSYDDFSSDDFGSEEPETSETPSAPTNLEGTYNITIWVSEKEGVADLTKKQINDFMKKYPGIVINAKVEGVPESDAASKVITDVAAPDIFCFGQDQITRLIQRDALAVLDQSAAANVIASNDEGAVKAATVAGRLYAYPLTSDNGYYMYYDKSIISEEDAESMEKLIAACEANNVKFRFYLGNAWYASSFFLATGCKSVWSMNEAGDFTGIDDDFNSAAGLVAMKGMQKLTQSPAYDNDEYISKDTGVVITGTWNAGAAEAHFGKNLAATDLPSFEINGHSYHLGSLTGNKLMGVKPQTDAKKAVVLSLLAQYLTNKDCQMERYEKFLCVPSNKEVQASATVQANVSHAALTKQSEHGTPQRQIHGSWWDIARVLSSDAKAATSDADLQKALDNYKAAIERLFNTYENAKNSWGVIGGICGTHWDTDFTMTKTSDTTWESNVLELKEGQEFKVRQGASWDFNFGLSFNGANIVVPEDGNYIVKLTWYGGDNGTVELIKQ